MNKHAIITTTIFTLLTLTSNGIAAQSTITRLAGIDVHTWDETSDIGTIQRIMLKSGEYELTIDTNDCNLNDSKPFVASDSLGNEYLVVNYSRCGNRSTVTDIFSLVSDKVVLLQSFSNNHDFSGVTFSKKSGLIYVKSDLSLGTDHLCNTNGCGACWTRPPAVYKLEENAIKRLDASKAYNDNNTKGEMVEFLNGVRDNMVHAIKQEKVGFNEYIALLPYSERLFCRALYEYNPNINLIEILDSIYEG